MTQALEPPRLLLDDHADPIVRRLLNSTRNDGPSAQRLLLAPVAIAAMLGTQTLAQGAAASTVAASAKVPLLCTAASGVAAGATSAGAGVSGIASSAAGTTSASTAAGAMGAVASASVTTGLAMLPALAKSVLIGVTLGGALVATVPDPVLLRHVGSPPMLQSGEPVQAIARGMQSISSYPQPPANVETPEKPISPAAEPIPAAVESPQSMVLAKRREANMPDERSEEAPLPGDIPAPDISREVAQLDAARLALGRNQPALALVELERYQSLSRRTLDPEATVLRVRALLASGRPDEAEAIARAFTGRAPNAPQARLLQKLTGIRNTTDPN